MRCTFPCNGSLGGFCIKYKTIKTIFEQVRYITDPVRIKLLPFRIHKELVPISETAQRENFLSFLQEQQPGVVEFVLVLGQPHFLLDRP